MSSDLRLKAAVAHWGPRFVANGVVLADFEEVTNSIASYDEWCSAWSKRAAHHEQLGREALTKKHLLTAGDCLHRRARSKDAERSQRESGLQANPSGRRDKAPGSNSTCVYRNQTRA